MKNTIIGLTILLSWVVLSSNSCKREDPVVQEDVAGKGGNAIIKATPQHHGENIDSSTIFLKYNAQDKPSTFDEQAVCVMENGKPVATFSNLKKGKYYIYGEGWDPDIQQKVVGGIPYTITEEKTIELNVPVTEGD